MKQSLILLSVLLLTACGQSTPQDASAGEINMAEMMGITVDELRNQTPEEHMNMMMNMGQKKNTMDMKEKNTFLAGQGVDLSTLPEAQAPTTIEVQNGDRIELNPTLVRKTILNKEFAMYGYNGQIPGPIIKVKQSSTIIIDVTNNIDMETTIHWHGLRLDNKNDGVPDVTQEAIQPSGTYTYTVKFPDEGIYWYHPHVREDIQQDLGLYGNLLVMPLDENAYNPVNREEVIVLDDLMLDDEGDLIPYGKEDATHPLMGRYGNLMLVNGETADDYGLDIQKGDVVRFYVTNVANTRTFRFHFGGAKMKLVGSDVGRYEKDQWVDAVTIAPAERYIVEVLFDTVGSYAFTHESPDVTSSLGTVTVTDTESEDSFIDSFLALQTNDDVIADIDSFREYFDKPIDKTLLLTIEMEMAMDHGSMMDHMDEGIEWEDDMAAMNAQMTGDTTHWKLIDEETEEENMDFMWEFSKGDIVKMRIVNDEDSDHPMQHPIHFHGQRFLVLSMDGKQSENLVWKDTVLIPTGSTADLLFDMSNPGDWMYHCHIAEHLTNGMMGMFRVSE